LDEPGLIGRFRVAALLDRGLDDIERFPAAEHMRICRHISGISHTRPVPVDTHFLAIELVGRCLTVAGIAREGFPEMAAFEEFERGAFEIGCLERIDEAEELRMSAAVELA